MMNINRQEAGFLGPVADVGTRGFRPSQVIGKVAHAATTYLHLFHAAQATARQAERYYAMSDSALARIGLTRDQIPAELLRELMR
jgi:uncharacterized protein YjiS (DUF1127 family)